VTSSASNELYWQDFGTRAERFLSRRLRRHLLRLTGAAGFVRITFVRTGRFRTRLSVCNWVTLTASSPTGAFFVRTNFVLTRLFRTKWSVIR
jgi:hypothetical protein